MSSIIQFKEHKRVTQDEYILVVYEAAVEESPFGYLYTDSENYALAWLGPQDFKFNGKPPYNFIEHQFSNLSPGEIEALDEVLPRRHPGSGPLRKPFSYGKTTVTLLSDAENNDFETYDLFDDADRSRYMEILSSDDVLNIIFARYDAEIITYTTDDSDTVVPGNRFNCCFTLENRKAVPTPGWEFALNIPRELPLKTRTLIWIARNHRDKSLIRKINFEESQAALHEKLSLLT